MIPAIFWDMDGTMVDSEPLWAKATFELSEDMGRKLTPELQQQTIGGSVGATLQLCADHAGVTLTPELKESLRAQLYGRVGELFSTQLIIRDGVQRLLGELKAAGVPMVVTTNTERELAQRSIAAVGEEYFVDSITGDEVAHPKPAPDMYLEAAKRVGKAPEECLIFEDSLSGMRGALAAGCRVIGLPVEPDLELPEGVVSMRQLVGTTSFAAVRYEDVDKWMENWPL